MSRKFPMNCTTIALGAVLACVTVAPAALAKSHTEVHVGVHLDLAALFRAIDANHDGAISRTEYANHANSVFKQCDTNGDGKLSEQELQSCQRTMNQQGVPTRSDASQTMHAMDSNHDGAVSQGEYDAYAGEEFNKMDTNHDGKLSPVEFRNGLETLSPQPKPQPARS